MLFIKVENLYKENKLELNFLTESFTKLAIQLNYGIGLSVKEIDDYIE
jgi:hypothetical protein